MLKYCCEIIRVCKKSWSYIQNSMELVESRENRCLSNAKWYSIVKEHNELPNLVAIYTRVSSVENKSKLQKQAQRLEDYAINHLLM